MVAKTFLPEVNQFTYVRAKAKWKHSRSRLENRNKGSEEISTSHSRQRLFSANSKRHGMGK